MSKNDKKRNKKHKPLISKDEMNIVEFPVTLLSRRHSDNNQKTLKFSDTITMDNNRKIEREWIVTGSDKYGLPLIQDNDVWIALMALGRKNGFKSRKIYFSRYQLCKIMKEKNGGNKYEKIINALNRLSGVRIYAKNAFWDNGKKTYITESCGIIDNYRIYEATESEPESDSDSSQESIPLNYININEVIYNSIINGYIKDLDTELYFNLKGSITKLLFRYLDKKRYNKNKFEMNLFKLAYNHLGFDQNTYKYASKIKEKLNPAHDELIKKGFLKSAEYTETSDGCSEKVLYVFTGQKIQPQLSESESEKKPLLLNEGNQEVNELLKSMTEAGLSEIVAKRMIKEYPLKTIKMQIEALPYREAKEPAALLYRSIQENWALPSAYQESIKNKKVKETQIKKQQEEERQKAQHREKIESYINSLNKKQKEELNEEALNYGKNTGNWFRDYYKDREIPQYLIDSYIHIIVEKRLGIYTEK